MFREIDSAWKRKNFDCAVWLLQEWSQAVREMAYRDAEFDPLPPGPARGPPMRMGDESSRDHSDQPGGALVSRRQLERDLRGSRFDRRSEERGRGKGRGQRGRSGWSRWH